MEMTQEQLRKIDALVAEKVMGCKVEEQMATVRGYYCGCTHDENGEEIKFFEDRPHNNRNFMDDALKDYSTDISAAWEVVEKLGFSVVNEFGNWYAGKAVDALYSEYDGENAFPNGLAVNTSENKPSSSAPLTICLAALKSVGVDVKEFE